jgi:hypothetical protein
VDHEKKGATNAVSRLAHADATWIARPAPAKISSAYGVCRIGNKKPLMLGEHEREA